MPNRGPSLLVLTTSAACGMRLFSSLAQNRLVTASGAFERGNTQKRGPPPGKAAL
jgi:hypothetical protein